MILKSKKESEKTLNTIISYTENNLKRKRKERRDTQGFDVVGALLGLTIEMLESRKLLVHGVKLLKTGPTINIFKCFFCI